LVATGYSRFIGLLELIYFYSRINYFIYLSKWWRYSWQEAFYSIEALFEIESLFPEQKEAIRAFIEKDVSIFVSLPTGAGKSMIFQSLPFVFDPLYGNP
jgi:superfamily II DNA helicase RecQ